MIIPKYWAECRERKKVSSKTLTVKRIGWSDISQEDAETMAKSRLNEAFEQLNSGEAVPLIERRVSYNGSDGMPIREEILDKIGDAVITRNIYGAQCLNVQNIFFADIDYNLNFNASIVKSMIILGILFSGSTFFIKQNIYLPISIFIIFLVVGFILKKRNFNNYNKKIEHIEKKNLNGIETFCQKHPEFKLRIYKTPSGLRLLALNNSYDPKDKETIELLKELGSDPNYIRMCINQNCFRARVSPKPWRINLKESLPHKKSVWPYSPEKTEERRKWIDKYEVKSQKFASCKYLTTVGTGSEYSEAVKIQELHDNLCRAFEDLPIA